jgi:hypothetical protein
MTTPFGRWGEPAFVGIYSPFGTGKTVDTTLFDPMGWTFAGVGALKSTEWFLGPLYPVVQQMTVPVTNFEQVIAYTELMVAGKMEARTIRTDDLSVLVSTTMDALIANAGKNKFKAYSDLKALATRYKASVRLLPVHTLASCHLTFPKTDESGKFTPGGPDMGGGQSSHVIAAVMDVIYKAESDAGMFPYPAVYRCDAPHPTWTYKDRHSAVFGVAPMNLREIFRKVGMAPARYPGMEWLDTVADDVAAAVLGGEDPRAAFARFTKHLIGQGVYEGHAYWAVRDGLDRAKLYAPMSPITRALASGGAVGALPGALPPPPTK